MFHTLFKNIFIGTAGINKENLRYFKAGIKLQEAQNSLPIGIQNKNKFLIKNISKGRDPFLHILQELRRCMTEILKFYSLLAFFRRA